MIYRKLRKVGNSYVITIPKEEVERRHLEEGQLLGIEIQPADFRPVASDELRQTFEASWERNQAGYRYLTNR